MISFLLIRLSIWLALAAWFAGSLCRAMLPTVDAASQSTGHFATYQKCYAWLWLGSAAATWVHVVASYGLVHGWDHQAVLRQTAEESFQATGLRAGWGVYVNFAYASVLLAYSVLMLGYRRRVKILDSTVFWFTAFIVFNAAIVFKSGPLRVLTSVGFVGLMALMCYRRFSRPE
jgi:hypothetical protein